MQIKKNQSTNKYLYVQTIMINEEFIGWYDFE